MRKLIVTASVLALMLMASPIERGLAPMLRDSVGEAPATAPLPATVRTPVVVKPSADLNATAAIAPRVNGLIDDLKAGLDALSADDLDAARAARDQMPGGSLDEHIMQWAIARSASTSLTSTEIIAAQKNLHDWPGRLTMRRNLERALFRENAAPDTVIATLGGAKIETAIGTAVMARALLAKGDRAGAQRIIVPLWRQEPMDNGEAALVLGQFGTLLSPDDHFERMQKLLYLEDTSASAELSIFAGKQELYRAWRGALTKAGNTEALLQAVPSNQRTLPAYLFAKATYLRKSGKYVQAAKIMEQAPRDAALLVDGDAWWSERRILARALLDAGDKQLAYQVASQHSAQSPAAGAEAEFHAGWIALRGLKKPDLAIDHFNRLLAFSSKPQSASRGYYWLGRAQEAAGLDSKAAYEKAAHFGTNFYGQLASAKLNKQTLEVPTPYASSEERRRFESLESVAALRRLQAADHSPRARSIYMALAEELEDVGALAMLANHAEAEGDYTLALKIGKIAANRGLDVGSLSHPTGAIPASADIGGSGEALAYAIARQESEFNQSAVSKAGARGLLQLMPATAKDVAKRNNMPYDEGRLVTDAAYNATLGAHFLGEQIERFDGSYILTFAGYNAGPRRSKEWIAKYGDPRGKSMEFVVDWIERIPFSETRNYVQRIMENYQVYKARLGGRVNIEDDLRFGRRN